LTDTASIKELSRIHGQSMIPSPPNPSGIDSLSQRKG
jgi:hypothetical protein